MDILIILNVLLIILTIVATIIAYLQYKKTKQQKSQINIIGNYFPEIVLEALPKNKEELEEKIKRRYGFIRDDLIEPEFYIASPIARYKTIERLNKYLNKRDINMIISSAAICRAEDEGKDSLAIQLHKSLVEVYGKRGKRIYNRLRSNIFDEQILPFLRELEGILEGDILRVAEIFQEYFDNSIEYEIIDRLWVSREDDYNSILSRIRGKFSINQKLNVLYIYVRKEYNITFTDMACNEFIRRKEDKFILEKIEPRIMRGKPAVTFMIKRKVMKKAIKSGVARKP